MKSKNLIIFLADEHSRRYSGCYGDPIVKTPHIDALAANGVRFSRAYTPSPICVSARTSLATGLWVHQTGSWDSIHAYDGTPPSWGHHLIDAGHRVVSFGKLGYRQTGGHYGSDQEFLPIHNMNGMGWIAGLLRNPLPIHLGEYDTRPFAAHVGVGETDYTKYDRSVSASACAWIRAHGNSQDASWVMFISLISPHYPLIAPQEFYNLYSDDDIHLPDTLQEHPDHPVLSELYRYFNYKDYMGEEQSRIGRRSYYALCSFTDFLVGEVMETLDVCGLNDHTRVIYTSDHGEMLGNHGMWTKMVMYEDSVGIPLILSGADVEKGKVVDTPVSLVDIYPTVLGNMNMALPEQDEPLPGHDLMGIAMGDNPDRHIISEYHDGGCPTGVVMLIKERWKYIHYAGSMPQLYDLENDSDEMVDLAQNPDYSHALSDCDKSLRTILDPEEVNRQAFTDQADAIERLGGVDAILAMEQSQIFIEVEALYDNAEELRTPVELNVRRTTHLA